MIVMKKIIQVKVKNINRSTVSATFGQVITSLESFRSDDVERFDDQHVEDISDLPVWSHFSCDLRWFSFEQDRVSIGAARWCGWCVSEGKKSASVRVVAGVLVDCPVPP